ncbi:MAG: hypothetical protein WC344_00850 [Bacilli bacterium]
MHIIREHLTKLVGWVRDLETNKVYVNERQAEIIGFTIDERKPLTATCMPTRNNASQITNNHFSYRYP